MDIIWDITNRKLVKSAGSKADPKAITLKYRGWYQCRLFIVAAGAAITTELAGTPTFTLGIKEAEKFDAQFLAETSDWSWNSTDKCYDGEITLDAVALRTAILDNADDSDDEASLSCNLEMQYFLAATPEKVVKHEGYLSTTIENTVIRGDEDEVIQSGSVYWRELPTVTGLTGGGATKLDGALSPTSVNVGSVVAIIISDLPQWWKLFAGTDAEDPTGGIVRPDNYNGSTNAVVWKRIA